MDYWQELNKIKRDILLSKAHITARYTIQRQELEYMNFIERDFEHIVSQRINEELVKEISKNTGNAKVVDDGLVRDSVSYEKQLLVFPPSQLKDIVYAVIQYLPDAEIKRIKDGFEQ